MCIFSGDIRHVGDTRIFARLAGKIQFLAYEMVFEASADVAMILPIPVKESKRRDAVEFVDLSNYTEFFEDLAGCFPAEIPDDWGCDTLGLKVHTVGSFHASYVPSAEDFSELDDRFKLAPTIWKELPAYADYGFVVFQFKPGHQKPHPMAFSFASAESERIYYPTTHIHDSAVHSSAEFDHDLYMQRNSRSNDNWVMGTVVIADSETSASDSLSSTPDALYQEQSSDFLDPFVPVGYEKPSRGSGVKIGRAKGLVQSDMPIYRRRIKGVHENTDIWA